MQDDFHPFDMSDEDIAVCTNKINQLLQMKAIVRVQPASDQFLSNIFPVIKKSLTDHRIIVDLTLLNTFVRKIRFKMDDLNVIIRMIRPGDYFTSVDISDAYYAVALHEISMPFVTIVFLNVFYQWTCLPQGLSSAPRIFTKIMRVVMMFLRSNGVRIAAWFDDLLLAASSSSLCADHTYKALGTLEELGFLPNYEKSSLTPVQRISHLGLFWDSVAFSVSVLDDKVVAVQDKCSVALSSRVSVRFLSSILGSIEYFRWGFPHAAVHYRGLQRFVNYCLASGLSYDSKVRISDGARSDLQWWVSASVPLPARSLAPFSADITLFSDASLSGWGGWTCSGREAFGSWSEAEASLHINILELQAVIFLFRCFFWSTYNCNIAVRSDNSTVVAYINRQGGTVSRRLCDLALELWEFCIARDLVVRASHVGGALNVRADFLSRLGVPDHSYFLRQDIFDEIRSRLSFPLKLDCFASRLNFKIGKFISRYDDPLAAFVNAFDVPWRDFLYLFPPFPILHRVFAKFISDAVGHGLVICPHWPSQSWYPTLLELLIDDPFLLSAESIQDPDSRAPSRFRALACPISSNRHLQEAY